MGGSGAGVQQSCSVDSGARAGICINMLVNSSLPILLFSSHNAGGWQTWRGHVEIQEASAQESRKAASTPLPTEKLVLEIYF